MTWHDGFPIEISKGGIPKSTRGPTLAAGWNLMFLAYQGEGGKKLYTSQSDASTGQFAQWTGNKQVISESGKHLETKDRPTIYMSLLNPSIIFVDHGSGNLMQTDASKAYGGTWSDPQKLSDFANYGDGWHSPLVSVVGIKSVLFVLDHKNNPWYTFQVFQADPGKPNYGGLSSWVGAKPFPRPTDREDAERGTADWFATLFTDPKTKSLTETVFGISRTAIHVYQSPFSTDPQNEAPWTYKGFIGLANRHATITNTPAGARIVFAPSSSDDLYSAVLHPSSLTLTQVAQISGARSNCETDQSPHIVFFKSFRTLVDLNAVGLAYKQRGSHELCFAYEPT